MFDILPIQNPWWHHTFDMLNDDQHLTLLAGKPYVLEHHHLKSIHWSPGDIHILRGPRQVGKTTIIKEWIQTLIAKGTNRADLLYLSCEAIPSYSELQEILIPWLQDHSSYRTYIFLDEISFVKEWQRTVLSFCNLGLFRNATVVITGSNARDLKESSERLPGRRGKGLDFELYPATPRQIRKLSCFAHIDDDSLIELYLRMGGFPHAIRDCAQVGFVTDETFSTYRNWIIGDAARYDLATESLRHMMYRVFATFASRVTLTSIIEQTPLKSHETGLRYLEHLDDSFLCRMHYCYDPEKEGPAYQKSRKVYFIDPLLYYLSEAWKNGAPNIFTRSTQLISDRGFLGRMLESAHISIAARSRKDCYFWYSTKTKKEVDLIVGSQKPLRIFDVKLSKENLGEVLGQSVTVLGPKDLLHDKDIF